MGVINKHILGTLGVGGGKFYLIPIPGFFMVNYYDILHQDRGTRIIRVDFKQSDGSFSASLWHMDNEGFYGRARLWEDNGFICLFTKFYE